MAATIEELLDALYTEIEEARNMPLNNDKCVVDRDRVLDMIDDVKAELPVEIRQAQDLVANRNDYIASGKREADEKLKRAEEYARKLVDENAIVKEAQEKADDIIARAEETAKMIETSMAKYCDDTMRSLEESVANVSDDVRRTWDAFRSAIGAVEEASSAAGKKKEEPQPARRAVYDVEAEEDED